MTEFQVVEIFLVIFAASFAVMAAIAVVQRRKVSARLERSVLGKKATSNNADAVSQQLKTVWRTNYFLNVLKAFSERIDVLKGEDPEALQMVLATAGYTGREPVVIYAFTKLTALLLGTLVTLFILLKTIIGGGAILIPLAVSLAIFLVLMRVPDFFLSMKRRERKATIKRTFPQMVELMIIASEAGLAPSPAMLRTADELSKHSPALSSELRQLVTELSVVPERADAYTRFSQRIDLAEAKHFGTALLQGEAFGTSFAATLKTMAKELRTMRMTKIEERATRLPVLMTVPLIMFIMPALFVVILGPAALSILDNLGNINAQP